MSHYIDHLDLPTRERLERAARAVAAAQGYTYRGESLVAAAPTNPRADQFVRIAKAVMESLDSGPPDGLQNDIRGGNRSVVHHPRPMKHSRSN